MHRAYEEAFAWRTVAIEKAKLEEAEKRRKIQEVSLQKLEEFDPNLGGFMRTFRSTTDKLRADLLAPIGGPPRSKKGRTAISAASLASKYILQDKYGEHHEAILADVENPAKAISELFLFHGWTTQFGIRIFSRIPDESNQIASELVYICNKLGQIELAAKYGIVFTGPANAQLRFLTKGKLAYSAREDFDSILDSRWQEYDQLYMQCNGKYEEFAHSAICERVLNYCGTENPLQRTMLVCWYMRRLIEIKFDAVDCGMWD